MKRDASSSLPTEHQLLPRNWFETNSGSSLAAPAELADGRQGVLLCTTKRGWLKGSGLGGGREERKNYFPSRRAAPAQQRASPVPRRLHHAPASRSFPIRPSRSQGLGSRSRSCDTISKANFVSFDLEPQRPSLGSSTAGLERGPRLGRSLSALPRAGCARAGCSRPGKCSRTAAPGWRAA